MTRSHMATPSLHLARYPKLSNEFQKLVSIYLISQLRTYALI